jgi:ATP-dependent Clp protease protease subunit
MEDGKIVTIPSLVAGEGLRIAVVRVWTTGTTARASSPSSTDTMGKQQTKLMALALRNDAASDSLEIIVFDVIGKDFFGDGMSAGDLVNRLRSAPKAKNIDLRVNSLGGLLGDAKAMVNVLNERAAAGVTINGFVDGIAASSAAVLLTAATRVVMPANAFQMVHQVSARIGGNAADLEAAAIQMRRENEVVAEMFAGASAKRGKEKTKQQWLDLLMSGDVYLDADQAIEWGIADEKIEDLKVAACLADLSEVKGLPEALINAPFVYLGGPLPERSPSTQPTNSGPGARQLPLPNIEAEKPNMAFSKLVITALALAEDADEAAVVAAVNKLKASAKVGSDIEQLLGASGQAALGAVRALKESNEANATLGNEVAKLKIVNVRRDFDSLIANGTDPKAKKLSPAVAKLYQERFENALKLANGDEGNADAAADKASDICDDLRGFLAVAPRITGGHLSPPSGGGGQVTGGFDGQPMKHGDKAFENMTGSERKALKDANLDLYNLMRDDAVARNAV